MGGAAPLLPERQAPLSGAARFFDAIAGLHEAPPGCRPARSKFANPEGGEAMSIRTFLGAAGPVSKLEKIRVSRRQERLRRADPALLSGDAADLRDALVVARDMRGNVLRQASSAKRAYEANFEVQRRWQRRQVDENARLTLDCKRMRKTCRALESEVKELRARVEISRKMDARTREHVAREQMSKWLRETRLASANADQRPHPNLWRPPRPPSPRTKWPAAAPHAAPPEAEADYLPVSKSLPLLPPRHLGQPRRRASRSEGPAAAPRRASPEPAPWG